MSDTYALQQWERGPKIVAIGGGTGLSTMLRGLKKYTRNLTAIVTVADNGGGSGMLRQDLGMPPPGDIRHCMESLANTEPIMEKLLTYRFTEGSLAGQSFGNLILAALNGVTGSFEEAVTQMSHVLAITGRVVPVTSADVQLEAVFENGARVIGESQIAAFKKEQDCRIHHVGLIPDHPKATPAALEAIGEADLILLGPGSLYTSVIPNLLVEGVARAVARADAPKIYICNIMTQEGETEGYTAADHLEALLVHGAPGLLDLCLANTAPVRPGLLEKYREEDAAPLAVDRELFSAAVTKKILAHPRIHAVTGREATQIPEGNAIIATGPLTSQAMSDAIGALCGEKYLSFYDASAPIVAVESIDPEKTFFATRYGRGEADYINCPFSQPEYDAFYDALVSARAVELPPFEREYFKVYEGCMPIEVMARRGRDTLRFGPMRPVGIQVPWTGHRPWANIQLRRDNAEGNLYNMVGFQTNLLFPEQERVFRMIPGLEKAQFMRYGVMHRNTFLNSPQLLDRCLRLKKRESLYFAGQITGVEGYMESAASGILAGRNLARQMAGQEPRPLPPETMLGALCAYISQPATVDFQPMGSNMGILPPLEERERNKEQRYTKLARRALDSLERYLEEEP